MKSFEYLILDGCVLLNLLATGFFEQILRASAEESSICFLVEEEHFFLRNETDVNEIISVDLKPFIESRVIKRCNLDTDDERQMFVNLAVRLDDGEAMSLAIALSRNWRIATDDKKARKVFLEYAGGDSESLLSTSDLIAKWIRKEKIDEKTVKSILLMIEKKAALRLNLE